VAEVLQSTETPSSKCEPATPAGPIRLERRGDGRLHLLRAGRDAVVVTLARPFPWTAPGEYVVLLNEKHQEEALIRNLGELDADTQSVLRTALAEASFVLEITAVHAIKTEFELRNWRVTTRQGPYVFQTKTDEWPQEIGEGEFVIGDLDGNLFHIADLEALDRQSQKLLWPFID
jgi:hypothetical protein